MARGTRTRKSTGPRRGPGSHPQGGKTSAAEVASLCSWIGGRRQQLAGLVESSDRYRYYLERFDRKLERYGATLAGLQRVRREWQSTFGRDFDVCLWVSIAETCLTGGQLDVTGGFGSDVGAFRGVRVHAARLDGCSAEAGAEDVWCMSLTDTEAAIPSAASAAVAAAGAAYASSPAYASAAADPAAYAAAAAACATAASDAVRAAYAAHIRSNARFSAPAKAAADAAAAVVSAAASDAVYAQYAASAAYSVSDACHRAAAVAGAAVRAAVETNARSILRSAPVEQALAAEGPRRAAVIAAALRLGRSERSVWTSLRRYDKQIG